MVATRLGVSAAFVDGALLPGDLSIAGGRVAAVGLSPAGTGLALPGFVDLQVNGFAGIDFAGAVPTGYARVAAALAATGVTSYQPTIVSLPEPQAVAALRTLAEVVTSPAGRGVLGMHLEGPFLAPDRPGAHDPAHIVAPDPDLLGRMLGAGPVTMVTLAPERSGALPLVEMLAGRGVVVSCGHTDASAQAARAAFGAGATAVTHLFNAQRPFRHRDPGLVGAALTDERVTVTLIVDGVHLAPETVRLVTQAAPGRFALITDAVAAAGTRQRDAPLGGRTAHVAGDAVRLDDGTLAGSVLTMDRAVRHLLELGIAREAAVAAATATPARLLGRPELGTLTPGTPADIVIVDADFAVRRTVAGGGEVFSA